MSGKLNFFLPTEIRMGSGAVLENSKKLVALGKKALIVTGKHSAKVCGALDDLTAAFDRENIAYEIFDGAVPNPTIDSVYAGAKAARDFGADFIAAIGGGSPMDTGKAIALLAAQEIPRAKLFSGNYPGKILPSVFIPTTAGTGSEVTQYSILTDDSAKTKKTIASPGMFPTLALLDSRYLAGLPINTAVNTALDALSHCIESFLANRADRMSSLLALDGAKAIFSCFTALESGNPGARELEMLQYGALLGGIVIAQTATTAVHAMGYSLTYFRHIDHGRANGLLLYEYLKFTSEKCSDKVGELLSALKTSLEGLGGELDRLLGKREEFTEEELRSYASIAIGAKNIKNCIAEPTEDELFDIYKKSLLS